MVGHPIRIVEGNETLVRVHAWPNPRAGRLIHSSDRITPTLDPGRWSAGGIQIVARRLQDGGQEKGRVLYLFDNQFLRRGHDGRLERGTELVGFLVFSVARGKILTVRRLEAARDVIEADARLNNAFLLDCLQDVAVRRRRHGSRIHWVVFNAEDEQDAIDRYQFYRARQGLFRRHRIGQERLLERKPAAATP